MPAEQGLIVGDGAACGIEDEAAVVQTVKKRLVAQVPCGPLPVTGDGSVERDDVAVALQVGQGRERNIKGNVPIFLPGWVVEQDVETELACPAGDDGADVAHADDA